MIHPKDKNASNPRMQCCLCAKWKRLHGTDDNGKRFQRFYGACRFVFADHLAMKNDDPDVCDECCKSQCEKLKNEN